MPIAQGVRDRIFAAADELHAERDRSAFPTVDEVRKLARVNMNDASTAMREWRRVHTAPLSPLPAQVPAQFQCACTGLAAALWKEATDLASENLRTAQTGWDAERAEAEELTRQMAVAYDAQTIELEEARREVSRLVTQEETVNQELARMGGVLESAERDAAAARAESRQFAVQAREVERRADDLAHALEKARQETSTLRGEMAAMRAEHAEQLESVRREAKQDLETERTKLERERDHHQELASQAAAKTARLQGKLEAMETFVHVPVAKPGVKRPVRTKGDGAANKRKS